MTTRFPDGFMWGTATAAYQIEGAVAEDGRGTSIWDTFSHTPGKTLHGDTGDIADDHYHRVEQDLELMAGLGVNGYRFSVAWPRIQPDGRGAPNQRGLDFYRRLVDGLRERSIAPALTMYHWDLPQALQDAGGWPNRDTAQRFAEYAALLFDAFGESVPLWITLNEPWVSAWVGYAIGGHAPGIQDTGQALAAAHHLLLAHGLAVQAFRARGLDGPRIGVTLNLAPTRAASPEVADVAAARLRDGNQNRWFLDAVFRGRYPDDMLEHYRTRADFAFVQDGDLAAMAQPIDFLGVNYYMRHTVHAGRGDGPLGINTVERVPAGIPTTTMGWGIEPDGLTELLVRIARDYPAIPMYVTENGASFYDYVDPEGEVDDTERIAFLDAHFRAAHAAIQAGVDLRGYFIWSLMDNFEWAHGYSKRFGLIYVDYLTQTRMLKQSASWYAGVARANALEP
ncbi:MAG TPA: GH1 family beta-glucosidase [Chloroflexota bacterium]|nr:GH1 family beta-glucosidase [Chloroflexota bacterium]